MKKIQSLYHLLLIDIETVPNYPDLSAAPDGWRDLFFDKIAKTVPEIANEEELYAQKAGILAEFGKIICISTGFFYEDSAKRVCLRIKSISGDDEKELLKQFLELLAKFTKVKKEFDFTGHNIKEFDIPYICRRLLINQIELPAVLQLNTARPWEINIVDTFHWWKFGDHKNYTSLHLLANVLGIPTSKTGIDGSQVQHVYYKNKDLKSIVEYCQRDVVVVGRIVQRFLNLPLVEDDNIFIVE